MVKCSLRERSIHSFRGGGLQTLKRNTLYKAPVNCNPLICVSTSDDLDLLQSVVAQLLDSFGTNRTVIKGQ